MPAVETIECRIYLTEDEMYAAAAHLQRDLHGLEDRIRTLADGIHELLCESGRVPVEQKATQILSMIRDTVAGLDLAPAEARTREVADLKSRIEECEREVAALGQKPSLRVVA